MVSKDIKLFPFKGRLDFLFTFSFEILAKKKLHRSGVIFYPSANVLFLG
jgi:hypothetical protein